MSRKIFFIILIATIMQGVCAQRNIELDFPLLGGRTAWLYYFSGSKIDSLSVTLNDKGKAEIAFPHKDYKGLGYLYIAEAGGGEFLLAEPYLRISCNEKNFNAQTLDIGESIENTFLQKTFARRSSLLDRQDWLQEGLYFELDKKEDSAFSENLMSLMNENGNALRKIDEDIASSKLYAARFMELTSFMQRLYDAVQKPNAVVGLTLQSELQYRLDIVALYHAGSLWNDVHKYYGGLFTTSPGVSDTSDEENDKAYALSLSKTMIRLPEPVKTAFFSSSIAACERSNRPQAAEILIKYFIENNPNLSTTDPNLQRLFNRYYVTEGSKAPGLVGLNKAIKQPALLFFYDSDCDHCRNEADWLREHYGELISEGYRIISISADTKANNYTETLPWNKADKLCDFNGFTGDNFRNYGVIGTPTIFELDENGVIVGRYAQAKDIFE